MQAFQRSCYYLHLITSTAPVILHLCDTYTEEHLCSGRVFRTPLWHFINHFYKSKQSLNNQWQKGNWGQEIKGRIQGFHVGKCLAEQQKREHLKSERKLSAGRIKQSKSANTEVHDFNSSSTQLFFHGQEEPDGLSCGPGHTTTGFIFQHSWWPFPSSTFVPQLPHLQKWIWRHSSHF